MKRLLAIALALLPCISIAQTNRPVWWTGSQLKSLGGDGVTTSTITAGSLGTTAIFNQIIQTNGGWDDLLFPANTIYAVGLTDIDFLAISNAVRFKATCNTNFASDNVWLVGQLPHSINTNSAYISPHIHFTQTSATQTNMFLVRYKRYKLGEEIPAAWTDLTVSNLFAYSSNVIHQIAETPNILDPFGISEIIDIKIWSRGGEEVLMKYFDIHFQRDSFGSDQEYSKSY